MIGKTKLEDLFAKSKLKRPEDAVGFLLWRVAHRYQREIDRACADVDLTHLQFVVLVLTAWLGRGAEPVTQTRLCAYSSIHKMQVSAILKAIEAKGLITRPRGGDDERVKRLELTASGFNTLRTALPLVEAAQRRFFGPDQSAGEQLHDSLRHIVSTWTAMPSDP